MGLLFLTASLEPGQDGVGDYTRRIAAACVQQGRPCHLLALNDPCITVPMETAEEIAGIRCETLRLPATLPWSQRTALARTFRERHAPDWISLQFVAYAFQPRGLVRGLAQALHPIIGDTKLHVMLHELWLGLDMTPSLKQRLMGIAQRHYILNLLHRLHPRLLTTSNPYYRAVLEKQNLHAQELSLCGNIPVSPNLELPASLLHEGVCATDGSHPHHLIGLFFGSLYAEWPAEPLLTHLQRAAQSQGKRLTLISVGKLGAPGQALWRNLELAYAHHIDFFTLGEHPVRVISSLLQVADFGLATSPWHLIGKSGSALAMLDHGLPVVVAREDRPALLPFTPAIDPLLHRCDATLASRLSEGLPKRLPYDRVTDCATTLLAALAAMAQVRKVDPASRASSNSRR